MMISNIAEFNPDIHTTVSDTHTSFGVLACIVSYNIEYMLSRYTSVSDEIGIVSMIRDNITGKVIIPKTSYLDGQSPTLRNDVIQLISNEPDFEKDQLKKLIHDGHDLIYKSSDGLYKGYKTLNEILFEVNEIIISSFEKEYTKYVTDISGLIYTLLKNIDGYFKEFGSRVIIDISYVDLLSNVIDEIINVCNFATENRMIIDVDTPISYIIFPHRYYKENKNQLDKIKIDTLVFSGDELPEKLNTPLTRKLRHVCSSYGEDMVIYPLGCYKDLKKVKLIIGFSSHRSDSAICVNYKFISDVLT